MNTPKNQQIEFDVFPKDTKGQYAYLSGVKNDITPETTPINVIFSHQSIIIVFIGIVMLLVASFTLGVEKGKLISRSSARPEKDMIAAANIPASAMSSVQAALPGKLETGKAVAPQVLSKDASMQATPVVAAGPALIPEAQTAQTPAEKPKAGDYVIQVATVKTQESAKRLAESLTKKGWKSFTKPSGNYVIVLAGNFSKREDAQSSIKELKKTYSDCFIKKI